MVLLRQKGNTCFSRATMLKNTMPWTKIIFPDGRHLQGWVSRPFQGPSYPWSSSAGYQSLPWLRPLPPWSWHVRKLQFGHFWNCFLWTFIVLHTGEIISYDRFVSLIVRGTPWDPWTAPWQAFLRLVGEDKYLLYVFGKYLGPSYNCFYYS